MESGKLKRYFPTGRMLRVGGEEGPQDAEYVIASEVDALMPREWDAESIKGAPGYASINFDVGELGSPEKCYRVKYAGDRNYGTSLWSLSSVLVHFDRGIIESAFGPIPQPPTKETP